MKKIFKKIISPRFYQYFLTINQKSNIRGNGVIKVGGVEQALRREDFSRTRIVGIFWLPISIGPSHPRIYNFLASNGSNESRGRLMKRIGTYTTRRESGTKGAPWLLESFTADCCVAPRRGADIRNWKFTLIIGRRANSWPFPFDRNKKVNFSLLNRVYVYIYIYVVPSSLRAISNPSLENIGTSSWANTESGTSRRENWLIRGNEKKKRVDRAIE